MKHFVRMALIATALVGAPPATAGLSIEFTHEGIGEGTLNGVPFGPSPFVITAFADTGDRAELPLGDGWFIDHLSAMIEIDGVGAFGILTPTSTWVGNNSRRVGFSHAGPQGRLLLLGPTHPEFGQWDMTTSIGPVFGNDGHLLQWDRDPLIETTGGILFFYDMDDVPVTFTAEVIPGAPAPLCLLPAAFVLCPRRRRRA